MRPLPFTADKNLPAFYLAISTALTMANDETSHGFREYIHWQYGAMWEKEWEARHAA